MSWALECACLLALSPAGPIPDEPEAVFGRAVEAYRAGDWTTARSLWLELLSAPESGLDRATLLYDLGNVAWREGRPLEAAAWYTACIRLSPRHADAWTNLELARSEAGLPPADRGDLSATLRRLLTALTPAESEWLVVGCLALLAAALSLEALRGGPVPRRLALASALLLLLGSAPWVWRRSHSGADPVFVVAADGAALRSQPDGGSAVVGRLPPGSEAERIDALPGWIRLEADGSRGWVEGSAVVPLAGPFER
jgi:tetratricopeptide (TPR) repeat protein